MSIRRYTFCALLAIILMPAPANALPVSAHATFDRMVGCVRQSRLEACQNDVTTDSKDIYRRFASYGLIRCLPDSIRFVSEKKQGDHLWIRASTQSGNQDYSLRLAFTAEE